MAVSFFEQLDPYTPTSLGWRKFIGQVQSDWSGEEFEYDFYDPCTIDGILAQPNLASGYANTYIWYTRVIVSSRTEFTPAPQAYNGLANKYRLGEAALFDTDVYGDVTYLNFFRQYIGETIFYTPYVTRAGFSAAPALVPVRADQVLYPGDFSGSVGLSDGRPIFGAIKVRPYDGVECRVDVYYRASLVSGLIEPRNPVPLYVFYP